MWEKKIVVIFCIFVVLGNFIKFVFCNKMVGFDYLIEKKLIIFKNVECSWKNF